MRDEDINATVSLLPARLDLSDEQQALDYIVLLICPVLNIRCAEVDMAFPEIVKRAKALKLARAA